MAKRRYPCSFDKACRVLGAIHLHGFTQTQAAIVLSLNVGTVCHIVHGRRFPDAYPLPLPGF